MGETETVRNERASAGLRCFIDGGYAALLLSLTVLGVGACKTQVLEAPPPPPPSAEPSPPPPARAAPVRRPWPSETAAAALAPVAAPVPPSDTLNGDPKGLKREALDQA